MSRRALRFKPQRTSEKFAAQEDVNVIRKKGRFFTCAMKP